MFTITVDVYTYKDTHTYEMTDTHSRLFALQGLRLHGVYVDVVKDSCLRMKKPLESLDKTEKKLRELCKPEQPACRVDSFLLHGDVFTSGA